MAYILALFDNHSTVNLNSKFNDNCMFFFNHCYVNTFKLYFKMLSNLLYRYLNVRKKLTDNIDNICGYKLHAHDFTFHVMYMCIKENQYFIIITSVSSLPCFFSTVYIIPVFVWTLTAAIIFALQFIQPVVSILTFLKGSLLLGTVSL